MSVSLRLLKHADAESHRVSRSGAGCEIRCSFFARCRNIVNTGGLTCSRIRSGYRTSLHVTPNP